MKNLFTATVCVIAFLSACSDTTPPTETIDGISITTADLGDREITIAESVKTDKILIALGCGQLVTKGLCEKCMRGQIRDMENNRPVRDCQTACKTRDCNAPKHEGVKIFAPRD